MWLLYNKQTKEVIGVSDSEPIPDSEKGKVYVNDPAINLDNYSSITVLDAEVGALNLIPKPEYEAKINLKLITIKELASQLQQQKEYQLVVMEAVADLYEAILGGSV